MTMEVNPTGQSTPAPAPSGTAPAQKPKAKTPVPVGQSTTSTNSETIQTDKKDPWADIKKTYKEKGFWAAVKHYLYDAFVNPECEDARKAVDAQIAYEIRK